MKIDVIVYIVSGTISPAHWIFNKSDSIKDIPCLSSSKVNRILP